LFQEGELQAPVKGNEEWDFFLWPYYSIRWCTDLKLCVVSTQLAWFRSLTFVKIRKAKLSWPTPWRHIQACRGNRVMASLIF